ncbi:MAG: type II toxin-antitoxin system mRNA interferase toxin, RelE/StbE family [Tistrella sp.]|uniref:Type II toxin-antitoxin system mRNA interferase toxin, RelE/StbE family n=1 Tax=Tistrella mobilis TaxID=171437 RepID=A0A3B9IHH0_9PROT|nr:type II toxin-antitoxin system YafQ family toxin [Tistrella sp.]MAD40509.1 type II toxin-antitoxin system mRNA interferase toxin, RelE/StbE family [Tistrella sp.]MAM75172.1 type II toxin-antitoxin system mRNA interferase toxin, RelE/StbE family [Tistrella sp.]MBA79017.1 type II toxin-antitoxin system mRNA interferase toxin, RelE/StbE family [Tistrella sp.]HAE47314.1 type II toxin-antitoxin system mRNA interferase toxin, RelE/StbE family [Tistrella mobilis]
MRTIERSSAFKRDYKREAKGRHRSALESVLMVILNSLAADVPLGPQSRDHALTGNWAGYRECHIRPDLLLIYSKPTPETLLLFRLGSHSELFG